MNVVWGIRWDREDDRRQRLLMAAALVAVLAAVALLLISRGPAQVAMHAVIVVLVQTGRRVVVGVWRRGGNGDGSASGGCSHAW